MNKTLEKILEDELFDNETFEGEGNLQIKNTSDGTKFPIILMGNTIQDGEPSIDNPVEIKNCKDSVNFVVCNRNLYLGDGISRNINTATGHIGEEIGGNDSKYFATQFIPVNKNINEYITARYERDNIIQFQTVIFQYNSEKKGTAFNYANDKKYTVALRDDTKYIRVRFNGQANCTAEDFYNIQVEYSKEVTEFIDNKHQTFNFPLKEGQVFHKNDYLADDGIHQVKDDYIFTGDEVIIYYDVSDIFYTNILNNLKKGGLTNYTTNYFKTTENSDYLHLEDSSTVGQNKDGRIHFKAKEYKSADDFKALLKQWYESGKPLRIEYELAEEKIIPYTPEQKEAYNKIMQAIAYDDETNIICTDEIPCNFKVNAKMSKIKKLEQINAQIGA